jgi:hypothetical protein
VRHSTVGSGDRDLLFVLGWGNRPEHEPVEWLLDGLADDDWTVHAVVVPENGTDFVRDYREPLTSLYRDVEPDVAAAHSLGGLALAHVPGEDPRVYSSPFWGFADSGLASVLRQSLAQLPTSRRLIPAEGDPEDIGDLKPPDETTAGERGISPAWLSAVAEGQGTLPAFRDGSVVYCSLRDRIVSTRAIGSHAPAQQVRLYDGGHEFFASSGREAVLERFRADLRSLAEETDR